MITNYHAAYYAHELTRLGGQGTDRLGRALFDASVDLNPHQIEAAIFCLRSPVSNGVMLADEVGLGKTIEAGFVICQFWAEQRRHILVICPASLRKQWELELTEKFNIPSTIIDAGTYKEIQKTGNANPFSAGRVIIASLHYVSGKAEEIKTVPWDLVVVDEAHKLRNAYRESNRMGRRIRWATKGRKKVLLTATPLQNSLLELYGLSTFIDEHLFGDIQAFRSQYLHYGGDMSGLRQRLKKVCHRTLRSQVTEFISYTERKLITRPFKPTEQEQQLYSAISEYLKRESAYALPSGQRHLLTLIVRKLLASSPHAVAGTLYMMRERLKRLKTEIKQALNPSERLLSDEPLDDELVDEILQDEADGLVGKTSDSENRAAENEPPIDMEKLNAEIAELGDYIRWAESIGVDTKSKALLVALEIGFHEMAAVGAARKVVIFTESRRTQEWLKTFLEENGYSEQVLTFNGTNRDDTSGRIYEEWLHANRHTGRSTGSKAIDLRAAIIDRFRSEASILIATEAGAEGLNLQFCSAVVNFDLPWNPQRIEQRIGRCHRYGQKHDVVVINFLNERNKADQRVYELLDQKFNLFTGIFGASDDILGAVESGVDFERRVLEIYQECRSEEAIQTAFEKLRSELDEQIEDRMHQTRKLLMEHFDEDVHDRLKVNVAGTREKLDRMGRMFWAVTRHELAERAEFNNQHFIFELKHSPISNAPAGRYHLISKHKDNISGRYLYRLSHPLGEHVIAEAMGRPCPSSEVVFNITDHVTRISLVESLKGKRGWLTLQQLRIDSFDTDDYLLFSGMDDAGKNIDQETCEKLFNCMGTSRGPVTVPEAVQKRLSADCKRHREAAIAGNLEENNRHFGQARDQLDQWAEDMEMAAQKKLDDVKRSIRDLQRRSRQAPTMAEQHGLQAEIAELERKKRHLRKRIFDIEDEIADKREELLEALERRMKQKTTVQSIFTIRWKVI